MTGFFCRRALPALLLGLAGFFCAHAVRLPVRATIPVGKTINSDATLVQLVEAANSANSTPIVLWHGMGDTCCEGLADFGTWLSTTLGGPAVFSVQLGTSSSSDRFAGYFANMNAEVDAVCHAVRSNPALKGGFYAIGLSQGALFLRAMAEMCPPSSPPMRRLIALGGPQRGVSQVPNCGDDDEGSAYCERMRAIVSAGAYLPWVRDHVVQAQYFRDPSNEDEYLSRNVFLPLVNNEREGERSQGRADALAGMEAVALVMFTEDSMLVPKETAWFWEEQADGTVVPMEETRLYAEDWVGLKRLNEAGRLHLLQVEGEHLQFSEDWFTANIVPLLTA